MTDQEKRLIALDEQYPEVKVFVNVFYELASINEYLLPHVEEGLKKLNKNFRFTDKQRMQRILALMTDIRKINDQMTAPFWESLPSATHTMMRRDANDIVRLLLYIIDRCGSDSLKFWQVEEWVKAMPSKGVIQDDIIEQFRLR